MNRRYEKFDILRGFAIIGVILIHITAPLATDSDLFTVAVNQISRFAVPVFFVLSGWGLVISNSLEKNGSYVQFLKKRFRSIVPQYLVWNIIYLFYSDVWETYSEFSLATLADILEEIFLGKIYNHLYFVPIILILYLLYPLLLKLSNKYGVMLSLFVTLISQISDLWVWHEYLYMNKNLFNWLFYFMFGIWLAKDFDKKVEWVKQFEWPIYIGTALSMFVVIKTPFFIGEMYNYNLALASTRPSVIVYSVLLILLLMVIKIERSFWQKLFLKLSEYSFYIYLNHYLFVGLWRDINEYFSIDLPSGLFIFISLIIITTVSYSVGVIMKKLDKMNIK